MQLRYKNKVLGGSSNIPTTNPTSEQLINAPIGAVMGWTDPDNIPQGWHICDGTEGTYDLRGKFILGASENHAVGETGGSEEVTLTVEQMPAHAHKYNIRSSSNSHFTSTTTGTVLCGTNSSTGNTTSTGSSEPHSNMPPYIALIFIQKISASPSDYVTEERVDEKIEEALANQNGSEDGVPSGFIGMWSGAVVPTGWALCDGTNGTPDLRGRFVLGESENHAMGDTGGSEKVTLTVAQMPEHSHFVGSQTTSTGNSYGGRISSGAFLTQGARLEYDDVIIKAGSSQPHPNMPPYYVLAYIMKL